MDTGLAQRRRLRPEKRLKCVDKTVARLLLPSADSHLNLINADGVKSLAGI